MGVGRVVKDQAEIPDHEEQERGDPQDQPDGRIGVRNRDG